MHSDLQRSFEKLSWAEEEKGVPRSGFGFRLKPPMGLLPMGLWTNEQLGQTLKAANQEWPAD